eukprot:TRINITY_DN9607_c0_g1_i1.p1 TRINITY_DN9607_c0_g1~~TRINITY_DN9607_c0_g1_i1.p1  ORF type:complete len:422 (-),score=59.52 TRINITY_DN9607_c0_g1_i1:13-1278(-)
MRLFFFFSLLLIAGVWVQLQFQVLFNKAIETNKANVEAKPDCSALAQKYKNLKNNHIKSLETLRHTTVYQQKRQTFQQCRMYNCFNFTKCKSLSSFKVYVYPIENGISALYREILSAFTERSDYTQNPEEACILIPSIDLLSMDVKSDDVWPEELESKLVALPHWNQGYNHLLWIIWTGWYPHYSPDPYINTQHAILALSASTDLSYRFGFDISVPHLKYGVYNSFSSFSVEKKYLLTFKGKRYVKGNPTGNIRNLLYKIDDGVEILMITTCEHKNWQKFADQRCKYDNARFKMYDYWDLLYNSTFGLVPAGRRLGTYRFIEVIKAGAIPVLLGDGYVLPFGTVLDWKSACVMLEESRLEDLPNILRNFSEDEISAMRARSQYFYNQYFSSIPNLVDTILEVLKGRIFVKGKSLEDWNRLP